MSADIAAWNSLLDSLIRKASCDLVVRAWRRIWFGARYV